MPETAQNLASYPASPQSSCGQARAIVQATAGCLLCGGPLEKCVTDLFDTRFGVDGRYEVRRCVRCGLEQIFPVPSPGELKRLYESYYNFGGKRGTLYEGLREWFLFSFLYDLWMRLDGDMSFHGRTGTGHLLDIGCNEGRSLKLYARNGFQVEGLELNEKAAAVAREAGFVVHACDIGDFQPRSPYDVAVLSNVLEHSDDPRQMLLEVHRILKPGGQIWISCPNSRSWLRSAFRSSWINWHVPFHISHFSAETLTNLLRESGFTTIDVRQISPALWVTLSVIAKAFAREGRPTQQMRNPILVFSLLVVVRLFFFPVLWLGNRRGCGDCLLVTAKA